MLEYVLMFPIVYIFFLLGNIFNVSIAVKAENKDSFLNGALIWYYISFGIWVILVAGEFYLKPKLTFTYITGIALTIMFINHVIGFVIYHNKKYSLSTINSKIENQDEVKALAIVNYVIFFGLFAIAFFLWLNKYVMKD